MITASYNVLFTCFDLFKEAKELQTNWCYLTLMDMSFESDQTLVVTRSQDVDQFNLKPTKTFHDLRGWCCSKVVASS